MITNERGGNADAPSTDTTPTSEREAWIRRSAQNLIDYPEILDLLAILDACRAERDVARTERAYWKDAYSGEREAAKAARAERDAALAALPDDPRVDDGYGGKVCYACMSYLDSGDGHNDGCQWAALRAGGAS